MIVHRNLIGAPFRIWLAFLTGLVAGLLIPNWRHCCGFNLSKCGSPDATTGPHPKLGLSSCHEVFQEANLAPRPHLHFIQRALCR